MMSVVRYAFRPPRAFLKLLLLAYLPFLTVADMDYGRCVVQFLLYDANLDFGLDSQEFANLLTEWNRLATLRNGTKEFLPPLTT